MDADKARRALDGAMTITETHLGDFTGGFPPPASKNGIYPKGENTEWTAGFYTGLMWMFWEHSMRPIFRETAERHLVSFRDRLDRRVGVDNHDMGFVFGLSCAAAYKLTGSVFAKETALLAADNLKSRFHEKGQFLQAWGKMGDPSEYRLIIDCLLNLPLLYWAAEVTGDNSYRVTAERHLETARNTVIREDFSTHHTFYFDPETGAPLRGATKQGYSDTSTWSRGQAWGICGLALNYKYTKDPSIPPQWAGVTEYFLRHLPGDLAAYWDFHFREGDEPRDSSASAITVCGILEGYRQGLCGKETIEMAYKILESLIDSYAARAEEAGNGLLKHSTYGRLLGAGIDEFTLWGDYFYTEALMRIVYPDWAAYW
ncbi:MAG: glycoside hydrolase family 88 protein [Oscillospiraceae bacterium]|jgi:unsaturated chondroitin disaccharide hydrolase|nr:glycoside hydrolase family 88 protein [Oscillospiraceae bacterium]